MNQTKLKPQGQYNKHMETKKQKYNIDGIGAVRKVVRPYLPAKKAIPKNIDSLQKIVRSPRVFSVQRHVKSPVAQPKPSRPNFFQNLNLYQRRYSFGLFAMIFFLLAAFSGGVWVALSTQASRAQDYEPQTPPGQVKIYSQQEISALGPLQTLPNDVLFNLPIDVLQNYLDAQAAAATAQQKADAEKLRAQQLKDYLTEKNSPFAEYADVLAKQSHWKILLAISFAESTFGKNCADNNCSNIGVKPGSPIWHKYANYGDWMVDFNKLLDKRYKDWTLEQMDGVYVQPKSVNWLLATKQVLDELQERGIQ